MTNNTRLNPWGHALAEARICCSTTEKLQNNQDAQLGRLMLLLTTAYRVVHGFFGKNAPKYRKIILFGKVQKNDVFSSHLQAWHVSGHFPGVQSKNITSPSTRSADFIFVTNNGLIIKTHL